jgi:hypothetical protein
MGRRVCQPRRKVYHTYGTRISSEWTLGFHGKAVCAIARVELKKAQSPLGCSRPVDAERGARMALWAVVLPSGQISLGWPDIFEFRVSGCGIKISGIPKSRVSLGSFRTYLLGPVLSFPLIRQGIEPLHGTVVVGDNGAILLMGDS